MSEGRTNARKDRAILVVSFGTSYADAREKNIDRIEQELQDAFADRRLYRAWTSGRIIRKLETRDHIRIDSVPEAMARMAADGVRDVIVQPTHVINGIENDAMVRQLRTYEADFERLCIGAPLLTSERDSCEVIAALVGEWAQIPKEDALVLMGHGTEHYANAIYAALDYRMRDMGYRNRYLGTVEAYPTLETLLRQVQESAARKVHLAPFMIVAGDHARNDMSGASEDSWANRFRQAGYEVECHLKGLGEYAAIRRIFVRHAREAV